MSVNKAILLGNLGSDPEIRDLPNGEKVANVSLATSDSWKDKNTGERKEKTEWHRLVMFRGQAKAAAYLSKGSKIYVEGKMQTRKWKDSSGVEKYTTEVVVDRLEFLDSKKDSKENASAVNSTPVMQQSPYSVKLDDDMPF